MKVIIDRFEGDFAVLELPDKSIINVNKKLFDEFSEGDIILINKQDKDNNTEEIFNSMFKD